jgi:2-dehydro-3-deoxyglucarate aldolase/4-hydroxy-2-oxoheptanedioate aldolase
MDMPVNAFKRSLAASDVPIGTWLMSASHAAAEALGCLGFDFLVVDMEHVPIDVPQTLTLLQAIAGTSARAVVRLAWNDPVLAKRVMDLGAQTLMFPFVQDAEEARRAVAATRYPPLGNRGFAAMHRASRYGTASDYARRANDEACVIVQLETVEAIERVESIAAVPGVDAIFVGPGDLAATSGHIGDIAHADVQARLRLCAQTCRRLHKPVGIVGPTPEMVGQFVENGYSFVAVASDMGMLLRQAGTFLARMREITAKRDPRAD